MREEKDVHHLHWMLDRWDNQTTDYVQMTWHSDNRWSSETYTACWCGVRVSR